jgi:diketogulonate reductase-like aldo/keto reductase
MKLETILEQQIPKIGLGTWQMRGDSCRQSVLSALQLGYRHLDTAEYYRNETEVGQAIRESGLPRDDLFITSKVWSNHYQRKAVVQACEDSLRRLDLDYLDLYLIHHPSDAVPLEETLAGMEDLVQGGKTRLIGVSNFPVALLKRSRELVSVPIFTNQVKYHPFHSQQDLLKYCQEKQILLTSYTPLDKGRVQGDDTLKTIGEKYGKTAAQVSLRWLIQQPMLITIPKASSRQHQQENLEVFDFQLTDQEMERIETLSR